MMLVCMGIVSCWQPTNRKNGTSFERSLFIAHLHKKEVLCVFFLATTLYFARSKEKKNLNLFSLMHTAAHIQLFIHSVIHSFIQLFSLHMIAAWMTAVEWALLNIKHGLCIMICRWNESVEFFFQTNMCVCVFVSRLSRKREKSTQNECTSHRSLCSFTRSVFVSHFTFSSFLFDDYCLHLFVVTFTYVHILYWVRVSTTPSPNLSSKKWKI